MSRRSTPTPKHWNPWPVLFGPATMSHSQPWVEAMKRPSRAGKPAKVRRRSALKPEGRSAPKAMPRRGSAPAGQDTEVMRLHASGMKRWGSRLRPPTFCGLFRVRRGISIASLRLFWPTLRVSAKQISASYCCTRVPNSVLPPRTIRRLPSLNLGVANRRYAPVASLHASR